MKYALFGLALVGALPLAALGVLSRKCLAALMGLVFVVVLAFDSTAVNFISYEFYRGTARGLEVSLAYILAAAVLLAGMVAGFLRPVRRTSLFRCPGTWLFLAYFAWCVVSACVNDNTLALREAMLGGVWTPHFLLRGRMLSLFELWKMAMLFLVYAATYSYLSHVRDAKAIFRALAFVVLAVFLMVVRDHLVGIYQVRGPFPHPNSLAMFMTLAGCVFFAAYLNLPKSFYRTLCVCAFVAASGIVFRTYSRGAILCYPLSVGFTALVSLYARFSPRKVLRLAPLALVGLLGLALMMPRIVERFEKAPESSGEKRRFFARTALNVVRDHPVAGVGLNNWAIFLNGHEECQDPSPAGRDEKGDIGIVETIYLLTAAECGWVGLALLLAWFLYFWIVALQLAFRLARTRWAYIPVGMLGGLTGCYLQSCLEWVLKQQLNFLLLIVCFATLAWLNQNERELRAVA